MGDSDKVAIAKAKLTSLLNKQDQAHVVRARLKECLLHAEKLSSASDQYPAHVTSLDGKTLTMDEGGEFCDNFQGAQSERNLV